MKKKVKKISLSKETLRKLNDSQSFLAIRGGSGSMCGNETCVQVCGRSGLPTC